MRSPVAVADSREIAIENRGLATAGDTFLLGSNVFSAHIDGEVSRRACFADSRGGTSATGRVVTLHPRPAVEAEL